MLFYLVFTVRMNVGKVNFILNTEWRMLTLLFIWVLSLGFPSPPQVVSCRLINCFCWQSEEFSTSQLGKPISPDLCFQNLKVSLCENLNSCQVKMFHLQISTPRSRLVLNHFLFPSNSSPFFNTQSLTMIVLFDLETSRCQYPVQYFIHMTKYLVNWRRLAELWIRRTNPSVVR